MLICEVAFWLNKHPLVFYSLLCDSAMLVLALAWMLRPVSLSLFRERMSIGALHLGAGLACDLRSAGGGGCASSLASGAKDAPIKLALAVRRPSSRALAAVFACNTAPPGVARSAHVVRKERFACLIQGGGWKKGVSVLLP